MDGVIGKLPLRAKVAQLVCPPVFGDGRDLGKALELARAGVGGFVLYEGVSPRETAALIARLREESAGSLPAGLDASDRDALGLSLSCDQENGAGQVVKGATELPPAMAFAAAGSAELMYEGARVAGREGRAMGFDLNYAPSADFTSAQVGPVESGRTFGGDLPRSRLLLGAYVRGYHDGGMSVTAKHFPGRGGVKAGLDNAWWCRIDKSPETVAAEDWASFRLAIEAGVDFVMTEHISVPSVTGDNLPASVSEKLVSGQLRGVLGFEGVITTDDLWYDEVCERFGPEEVGVLSFLAGHDVLLKPRDPLATIEHVLEAIAEGRLTEARIDRSLARLLAFKRRFAGRPAIDPDRAAEVCGCAEHLACAQRVADASVTVLTNRAGTLPVAPERLAAARSVVHLSVVKWPQDAIPVAMEAELGKRLAGKDLRCFTLVTTEDNDPALYATILEAAASADLVLVSLSVARNRLGDPAPLGAVGEFLSRLTASCEAIALSHGNPYVLAAVPGLAAGISAWGEGGWFGNKLISVSSLVRVVTGELAPKGTLPVVVGEYPIGHGLTWTVG